MMNIKIALVALLALATGLQAQVVDGIQGYVDDHAAAFTVSVSGSTATIAWEAITEEDGICNVDVLKNNLSFGEYYQALTSGTPVTSTTVTYTSGDTFNLNLIGCTDHVHVQPIITDTLASFTGDTSYTGVEGDTISGDLDAADADGLTDGTYFTVSAQGTEGTATIDATTGVWAYVPTVGTWFGTDTFTVTVTDDASGTTAQDITVTLTDAPAGWLPTEIAATTLWLDMSDSSTMTLSGNDVQSISDQSGLNNDAVQTVVANRPEYSAAEGAVFFDGTEALRLLNDPFKDERNFAVIVVTRRTTTDNYGNTVVGRGDNGGDGWELRQRTDIDTYTLTISETAGIASPLATATDGTVYNIIAGATLTSNQRKIFINGSEEYTTNSDTGTISFSDNDRSMIGAGVANTNTTDTETLVTPLFGYIKEVVYIPGATLANIEEVEGYLAEKHSITLDAGHPYVAGGPTL